MIPTHVNFYGLPLGEEVSIDIEEGKTLIIKLIAISEPNDEGNCKVFFELNGQPRDVLVPNKKIAASVAVRAQADETNVNHVGAPMPGMIVKCMVVPMIKLRRTILYSLWKL